MENTSYTGISRLRALENKMDLVSNNIANSATPGYRSQNMVFKEYLSVPRGSKEGLSMVLNFGQYQNTAPGNIRTTNNPLDIALNGPGFFAVEGPDNQTAYTKGGSLQITSSGELTTSAGHGVQGEGGTAITIPTDAKDLRIARDGTISSDAGELGRIKIAEFKNEQDLVPIGDALYLSASQPAGEALNTTLVQGALEDSNVNPVMEMSRMIEVSRSYQSTAKMLQGEHDRLRGMIRQLSKSN